MPAPHSAPEPNENNSFFQSLGRLYPFFKPILPRLIAGLVSALVASVAALSVPQVYRVLINDSLHPGGAASSVWIAALLVLSLGIIEAGLIYLRRVFVITPTVTVERELRTNFYRHVQRLSVAFHDRWGSGQLLSRAMTDLNLVRRWMAFGAIILVSDTLTVIIGIGMMFTLSWELALVFTAAAIPIVIIGFRFNRYFRTVSRRSQDQAGDLATAVEESVHGIRVLKAFGRGKEALDNFSAQALQLRETEILKAKSIAKFSLAASVIPEVALGTALTLGVFLTANGQLSVGSLAAFFATAAVAAGPVAFLGALLSMSLSAKTAIDRHFDVLDTVNDIDDAETTVPLDSSRAGDLEFKDVHFAYQDATSDILKGVDLHLIPGETMALVGVTGSGKSTLLQLVPRLYDVTGGAVLVDGVDVRQAALTELRRAVAVAFEDTTLFSSSVRENVLLGSAVVGDSAIPDLHSPEADAVLDEALDVAQAHFAYALPNGVDTLIGEEGLSLSGGQRQRIALARAIAAKPEILILDDPLSALDVNTEELVENRLREVLAETTTLIVAHRPSTVTLADRVALLRDGVIDAVGTHAELLSSNAHYRFVLASLATEPEDLDSDLEDLDDEFDHSDDELSDYRQEQR